MSNDEISNHSNNGVFSMLQMLSDKVKVLQTELDGVKKEVAEMKKLDKQKKPTNQNQDLENLLNNIYLLGTQPNVYKFYYTVNDEGKNVQKKEKKELEDDGFYVLHPGIIAYVLSMYEGFDTAIKDVEMCLELIPKQQGFWRKTRKLSLNVPSKKLAVHRVFYVKQEFFDDMLSKTKTLNRPDFTLKQSMSLNSQSGGRVRFPFNIPGEHFESDRAVPFDLFYDDLGYFDPLHNDHQKYEILDNGYMAVFASTTMQKAFRTHYSLEQLKLEFWQEMPECYERAMLFDKKTKLLFYFPPPSYPTPVCMKNKKRKA